MNTIAGRRILRCKDVEAVTGLSRSSIYRLMNRGLFPQRVVHPHVHRVGWFEDEVARFNEQSTRQPLGDKA